MKISSVQASQSWSDRVRASEAHPGGYAAYCREQGIGEHQLYYQRKKMGRLRHPSASRTVRPAKQASASEGRVPVPRRPAFVPVVLDPIASASAPSRPAPSLPSAKWVAELILHLSQGARSS